MSNVYIDVTSNNTNQVYRLLPPPSAKIASLRGGQLNEIAVYDIRSHSTKGMFNIGVVYNTGLKASLNYPSVLFANRYIIGMCIIVNYKKYVNGNTRKILLCRIWTREG